MRKLYSIQYLRALAALAVVAFHAGGLRFGDAFRLGAAGVDIFFVISGFVMWTMMSARPQSPGAFIVGRIVRIAPTYWLLTLTLIGVATAAPGLFPNMKMEAAHTVASLLFIPARSPINGELWPALVQGWTLNYEMFFYAIFATVILLPAVTRIVALIVVFGTLLVVGQTVTGTSPVFLVYTDQIMVEFLAGILLAGYVERTGAPSLGVGWFCLAAAVVGYVLVGISGWLNPRLVVWGLPAFLLVAGLVEIERAGGLVRSSAVALIGDASYSIYLTHGFTISILGKIGSRIPSVLFVAAGLALATVGGIAVWWLLERPMTRTLQAWVRRTSGGHFDPQTLPSK